MISITFLLMLQHGKIVTSIQVTLRYSLMYQTATGSEFQSINEAL